AEEIGSDRSLSFGGRGGVKSGGTRLAQQGVRGRLRGARRFLLLHFLCDLALHLGQRLEMGVLLVFDADDLETEAALNQVAGLSLGEGKGGFVKFSYAGTAAAEPAQLAPVFGASGVFRIFLRQLGKISPRLDLLQYVFGFGPRIGNCFLILLLARRGQRSLDENVADFYLFGRAVLVAVLIVIGLQVQFGNGGRRRDFRTVDDHVLDLPLLRDGVVIRCLVAFVISLEFFLGRMQSFQDVILCDHGIFELDLGVTAVEFVAHLALPDESAARNQGAQLAD